MKENLNVSFEHLQVGGLQIFAGFEHLNTHNSVLPRSSQAVHTSAGNTIMAEVKWFLIHNHTTPRGCLLTSEK